MNPQSAADSLLAASSKPTQHRHYDFRHVHLSRDALALSVGPYSLSEESRFACWMRPDGALQARYGHGPTFTLATSIEHVFAMTHDEDYLYCSTRGPSSTSPMRIERMSKEGGAATVVVEGRGPIQSMCADWRGNLYWTERWRGVFHAQVDKWDVTQVSECHADEVVATPVYVAWTTALDRVVAYRPIGYHSRRMGPRSEVDLRGYVRALAMGRGARLVTAVDNRVVEIDVNDPSLPSERLAALATDVRFVASDGEVIYAADWDTVHLIHGGEATPVYATKNISKMTAFAGRLYVVSESGVKELVPRVQ